MKNATTLVLTGLLVGALSVGSAGDLAGQTMYGGSYGLSQSLSDTKDFANDLSARNLSTEFRTMRGADMSFGMSIGWHVFHEEVVEQTDLVEIPVSASGLQFRTINHVPILATAHKYFGERRQPRVYVGLGAGMAWTEARVNIGVFTLDDSSWDFTAVPEVGVMLPLAGFSELMFNAKYQWSAGDLGTQALYFNIGIVSWPFSF